VIEYGLIAALTAVAAVAVMGTVWTNLSCRQQGFRRDIGRGAPERLVSRPVRPRNVEIRLSYTPTKAVATHR